MKGKGKKKVPFQCLWLAVWGLLVLTANSLVLVQGVGIGASPPVLYLQEGVGRITVFNAAGTPVIALMEPEGDITLSNSVISLGPWGSAMVLVSGERGRLLILTDHVSEGMVTGSGPSVEIMVVSEGGNHVKVYDREARIMEWTLIGFTVVAAGLCVAVLAKRLTARKKA